MTFGFAAMLLIIGTIYHKFSFVQLCNMYWVLFINIYCFLFF